MPGCPTNRDIYSIGTPLSDSSETKLCRSNRSGFDLLEVGGPCVADGVAALGIDCGDGLVAACADGAVHLRRRHTAFRFRNARTLAMTWCSLVSANRIPQIPFFGL